MQSDPGLCERLALALGGVRIGESHGHPYWSLPGVKHSIPEELFTPDTNMGICWDIVVRAMAERGWFIRIIPPDLSHHWLVNFQKEGVAIWSQERESLWIKTIPHVICVAALEALEVK